jgi:hypothetical protein
MAGLITKSVNFFQDDAKRAKTETLLKYFWLQLRPLLLIKVLAGLIKSVSFEMTNPNLRNIKMYLDKLEHMLALCTGKDLAEVNVTFNANVVYFISLQHPTIHHH